jgi:hypothetical protein
MDARKANSKSRPKLQVIGVSNEHAISYLSADDQQAGLPRTGTMSLSKAMEILGYTPCHHFKDAIILERFPYPESRAWQTALTTTDGAKRRDIIRAIFEKHGCQSAVDYPTSAFIEDLVDM